MVTLYVNQEVLHSNHNHIGVNYELSEPIYQQEDRGDIYVRASPKNEAVN